MSMMMKRHLWRWVGIVIVSSGCTAALDFDALQTGLRPDVIDTETDTDGSKIPCDGDSDCNDNIDCTEDKCSSNGFCTQSPSNAECPGFEVCRVGEGCVDIGRECLSDDDCDDGIDCTRNACSNAGKCQLLFLDDDACRDPDNLCLMDAVCDETLGCIGGLEKPCEQVDGPYCYNTVCTPSTGKCDGEEFRPGADKDGDGYCNLDPIFGGDDCDDNNDVIHPGAEEIVGNGVDDDCDSEIDEETAR